MDEKTQKERLEQELRFLKESLDAEVISKEEFEKGKERIERKLKELSEAGDVHADEGKQEQSGNMHNESSESKNEDTAYSNDGGKIRLKVIQDEDNHAHGESHEAENTEIEQDAYAETARPEPGKNSDGGKFWKYSAITLVLLIVAFFSYSLLKQGDATEVPKGQVEFISACSSDKDCMIDGKEGTCLNPGAEDARCEPKAIEKTSVLVINDRKNCFNCDSGRVLGILESWFGPVEGMEIDYNSIEGKELAQEIDARILPVYILNESISNNPGFEKYGQAFAKKGNHYVLSDDAAGSTFYFKRELMSNKLDLFVIEGDSSGAKAENNLKEFLNTFDDVQFEKHFSDSNLAKELGIKTFPAFLVNNQVKFNGVQTSETVRNNFCSMNKVEGCDIELSKSLI